MRTSRRCSAGPVLLSLLCLTLLASCPQRPCPPCVAPARTTTAAPEPFWTLRGVDAPPTRLLVIDSSLRRCATGLKPWLPGPVKPLKVIGYGSRDGFLSGLITELGFKRTETRFFARGGAPRPMKSKMLVPPDQTPVRICHELVHHVLESHTPKKALMKAKWLDEGTASELAARIFGQDVKKQAAWFGTQPSYVPFYITRGQQGWAYTRRNPAVRRLVYAQAQAMMHDFFERFPRSWLARLLERARKASVDRAFRQVTGLAVERYFEQFLDRRRGAWHAGRFDRGRATSLLPRATPQAVGLDPKAVQRLIRRAQATRSDALLLIKDGRVVVDRRFLGERGAMETMSVTKSIVSLAIGLLLAEGKIRSVDQPLHTWLPTWRKGPKSRITLRHVLTHTSGLKHPRAAGQLTRQRDRNAWAAARPVAHPPGTRFYYSNEASQLLSEVVRKAAGQDLDAYLATRLFSPLSIRGWRWQRDPAGNVQAFFGLALSADDLARIGLLLLAKGRHRGKQLLSASWVQASTRPGLKAFPFVGYLWWLRHRSQRFVQTRGRLARLIKAGLPGGWRLRALTGRRFKSRAAYWLAAAGRLRPFERRRLRTWLRTHDAPVVRVPHDRHGFNANGWQGQYLAVYPRWDLVAVRQRRPTTYTETENKRHGWRRFFFDVERTVKQPSRPRKKTK